MTVEMLRDEAGRALAAIEVIPRGSSPRADVVAADGADASAVAVAVRSRLPGFRVSVIDDDEVADRLLSLGGTVGRHLLTMELDLRLAVPSGRPCAATIGPMEVERTADYGAIVSRAYPPGHPDHEPSDAEPAGAARTITELLRGEQVGPWLPEASFDARDGGRVLGAVLLSEMPPSMTYAGGPWVTEIFVDPEATGRGIGGALLARAAAAVAGAERSTLGLAVTVGNPARRLYESLGFVTLQDVRQVVLPA
jgi:GNAT superfamily N-acetyltransferase